ncbi:MAG: DnaJ domain-containing protein [Desulfobacterales bacterium]|nr:DnaJ domain-containing protein [Desulfobacterales bacterium]
MDTLEQSLNILGLQDGASPDEAKKVFRELVKLWHPDRFERLPELRALAEERLKEINEAYDTVKSFHSRGVTTQRPHVEKKAPPPRRDQKERPREKNKEAFKDLIKEFIPAGRDVVQMATQAFSKITDVSRKLASALPFRLFSKNRARASGAGAGPAFPDLEKPPPAAGLKRENGSAGKSFKEVFDEVAAAKRRGKKKENDL